MISFVGVLCFQASPYSVTLSTKSGRTPLLPFQALLLFRLPSELTLRTLFALPAFGVTDHTLISLTFRLGGRLRAFRSGLFGLLGGRLLCLIPGGGHELNVKGDLRPVFEGPLVDIAALL